MSKIVNNRVNFASVKNQVPFPDFLDVQLKSFEEFLQLDSSPERRKNDGLYKVFSDNFPVEDGRNSFKLSFLDYNIGAPRYTIEECLERGLTYSVALKAKLKLECTDPEHEDFATQTKDVFLGDIPYMTPSGTFVINGAERVVVSQLHRSPGVFFGSSTHTNGTPLYSARIIPFKGSWIEFSTDAYNVMYAYIDRKKKLPVTTLLRAIGYEHDRDILNVFNLAEEVKVNKTNLKKIVGRKLAARIQRSWREDFVDEETGEVSEYERTEMIYDRETEITEDMFDSILDAGVDTIFIHHEDESSDADYKIIFNTLQKDPCHSETEALRYIYSQLRNAEPPDDASARELINNMFFSEKRYSLGDVGRYRINRKLKLDTDPNIKVLTKEEIVEIIKYIVKMANSKAIVDDIDHLSNRRVRTVGEQLANQFATGLVRMTRTIRERMNVRDNDVFGPEELINAKTIASVINSFFGTNPLSQFMEQNNPLAEVTHKRRLSALGPGGLTRERAGFEVRDVHYTHYGRLCPIESPEGPNIGLISSLCVYAKINNLGFIETPYRTVKESVVNLDDIVYLTAEQEEGKIIGQGNAPLDDEGHFIRKKVKCRKDADYPQEIPSNVEYMDVAPQQIASIAAALIPFLEHDDAHRALMGSNMMRQAVPLLRTEAPIVGTGIEKQVCDDSRTMVVAEGPGTVEYVDATTIRILYDRSDEEELVSFVPAMKEYKIAKFRRTNQNMTCDLRPICECGQRVNKGDVLTEGYATSGGELALGRNLLVAYMPWKGYNYEDAIVLSERVVREDLLTSVHVDEYSLEVREMKRGMEELTSDIPNVSEEATKDLDENGIIRVGAHVEPGDILIGKITPKGEADPSPEEKLLRAIFGDKAGDVKDVSLKANPSLSGVVIDKKLFSKVAKDRSARKREKAEVEKVEAEFKDKVEDLKALLIDKLLKITKNKTSQGVFDNVGVEVIPAGSKFLKAKLQNIDDYSSLQLCGWTDDEHVNELIRSVVINYLRQYKKLDAEKKRKNSSITIGDELPSSVIQMAKVYIAKKRKIGVGDKMAGRHGNKGIVSKIVRQEDMPFLEDGTPVDIVLNPLGVPSRMNLGQIFESVLGYAGSKLGVKFATPIFDGATLEDLCEWTDKAGLPRYGRTYLYNGETGLRFDQPATVGVTYMLKLAHMVEDKMHARSIGPYSLITQQPLGGKAQFGGQRFGEMEVWALEAFGASHVLQEILTIKSDDVTGRSKAYEAIVKGDPLPTPGIPESLNVLLHELRGLGLSITLE